MLNNNIEILSPVGDFECLKAAVQNGANAVYLGAQEFNARYSASNFDMENLEKAIIYTKTRNVKVHLVLNILIKSTPIITSKINIIIIKTFFFITTSNTIIPKNLLLFKNCFTCTNYFDISN